MSTNFPNSIDTFPNPSPTDKVNNATALLKHSTQHTNINDAVEALEAKVGANSSAVTTSHDYKLSGVTGSDKAASLTGTEVLTNKTINVDNNTVSNIETDNFKANVIDTDGTLAANSDTRIATQKAVKTYVDTQTGAGGLTKVYINLTQKSITGTSPITYYTAAIPGGILSTNNAIQFELLVTDFQLNVSESVTIGATYGGNAICTDLVLSNAVTGTFGSGGTCKGYIVGNGATNTQKGWMVATCGSQNSNGNGQAVTQSSTGTPNVDSTVSQNLVITVTSTHATNNVFITDGIIVTKI